MPFMFSRLFREDLIRLISFPQMHELRLDDEYFSLLKECKKVYEMRINDDKRKGIHVGDLIKFHNRAETDSVLSVVDERLDSKSFDEAVQLIGYDLLMPNAPDAQSCLAKYRAFPGYRDGELLYGVVVFKLKLL